MIRKSMVLVLGSLFLFGIGTHAFPGNVTDLDSPDRSPVAEILERDFDEDGKADITGDDISFLSVEEAKQKVTEDDKEPYFSELSRTSISFISEGRIESGSIEERREELIRWYQSNLRSFTKEEKEGLSWAASQLQGVLDQNYSNISDTPWTFVKITNEIAMGFPHTIGNVILFPEKITSLFAQLGADPDPRRSRLFERLVELLMHEQTHVIERLDPTRFHDLYREVWGFRKAESIQSGEWVRKHELQNPDGMDTRWVYPIQRNGTTEWIWPLAILSNPDRNPRFQKAGIYLRKEDSGSFAVERDGRSEDPRYQRLSRFRSYSQYFQGMNNNYHPHEILADALAKFALEALTGDGGSDGDWKEPTKRWFQNHVHSTP